MKNLTSSHTPPPSERAVLSLRVFCQLVLPALMALLLCSGCASAKVDTYETLMARQRAREPILLLPPIAKNPRLHKTCESLGQYMLIEAPKRVDGQIVYASDIDSLDGTLSWENLIENGTINCKEVAAISQTVGCNSAVTCQVLETKPYPPFRMVVNILWIDSRTGNVIGRLFNDVDLSDTDTLYRYNNYAGEGPSKKIYEMIFYSEGLAHSAYISPEQFLHFVAAYSTKVIFDDKSSSFWNFWRIF